MKKLKLKFYTDPSHGWLAAKRELVENLGIKFDITHFSYQKGNTVYLEEDCDAKLLVERLKNKGVDVDFEVRSSNNRSHIRSYEQYRP